MHQRLRARHRSVDALLTRGGLRHRRQQRRDHRLPRCLRIVIVFFRDKVLFGGLLDERRAVRGLDDEALPRSYIPNEDAAVREHLTRDAVHVADDAEGLKPLAQRDQPV